MGGVASVNRIKKHVHRKEGEKIPSVSFRCRVRRVDVEDKENELTQKDKSEYVWKDISSEELFKNKRVVIFQIPGAFTPVCSCDHLPGYEANYDKMKACGIDEVYCISMNDAFVMRQWGLAQNLNEVTISDGCPLNPGNFKQVKLLPDAGGKFTKAMGMNVVWDKNGLGERAWRYSAVINDMVIEKIFAEEEKFDPTATDREPDPLLVSDAETMVKYLQSTVKK